jgi:hypothetical protein
MEVPATPLLNGLATLEASGGDRDLRKISASSAAFVASFKASGG